MTSENYFGRWGNTKENRREILFTDSQIRSLDADWSYPDDPARVLAAVGRLNPSFYKHLDMMIFIFSAIVTGLLADNLPPFMRKASIVIM